MINEMFFMNGYAVYVLSAFSFTLLSFLGLYFVTKMQFIREQNIFNGSGHVRFIQSVGQNGVINIYNYSKN